MMFVMTQETGTPSKNAGGSVGGEYGLLPNRLPDHTQPRGLV